MLLKHTWVCSICAQGFTRKPSAQRHNNNLRHGEGMIVRPFEYIIGRLQGKYPISTDPSVFVRKKRRQTALSYSPINNPTFEPLGHEGAGDSAPKHSSWPSPSDIQSMVGSSESPAVPDPKYLPGSSKPPTPFQKNLQRKWKLDQITMLSNKYFVQEIARETVERATRLYAVGDDFMLDGVLESLRKANSPIR
jgi:hypothetical protein